VLVFVFLLFVLETLVQPRVESVGVASVAYVHLLVVGCLKMSGLSFCGRVETNFDEFFLLHGCEESIDAVGASLGCLRVEKA
jgi:hypothetical protein